MQSNQGRIGNEGGSIRDRLETAQTLLFEASLDLDEVALRIRQAIRRSNLVRDVLQPAAECLEEIHQDMRLAQREVKEAWEEGQERKWRT